MSNADETRDQSTEAGEAYKPTPGGDTIADTDLEQVAGGTKDKDPTDDPKDPPVGTNT